MFKNILITFLMVSGCIIAIRLLIIFRSWISKPKNLPRFNAVVPVYSETKNIEQIVRFYRSDQSVNRLILLNLGADDGICKACEILERESSGVYFCSSLDDLKAILL